MQRPVVAELFLALAVKTMARERQKSDAQS